MENLANIETAQNVAAVWFIIWFGICMIVPLFTRPRITWFRK